MREWLVFWTFSGNYADSVKRVKADSFYDAIMNTYGHVFNGKTRYIVFEVGRGLAFDGTAADAAAIVASEV